MREWSFSPCVHETKTKPMCLDYLLLNFLRQHFGRGLMCNFETGPQNWSSEFENCLQIRLFSPFWSFCFQQVSMLAWGCVNVCSSFKAILSCESASSRWTWSHRLFCAWWEGNGNCGAFKFRHWNIFTIDVHKEKCPSFFLHIAFPLLLNDNSTRQFCGVYHSLAADIKGHARWRAQCQSLVDSFGILYDPIYQ